MYNGPWPVERTVEYYYPEVNEVIDEALHIFKCYRCGRCCENVPAQLTTEEIQVTPFRRTHEDGSLKAPCPFYSPTRKECNVYSKRPMVCRQYPLIPLIMSGDTMVMRITNILTCKLASDIYREAQRLFKRVGYPEPVIKGPLNGPDISVLLPLDVFEAFVEHCKDDVANKRGLYVDG